ncbi:MAG: glutaredoxin family protein [Methanoregulaceae archaeon]|nr:glutaredoxin family protein [Methanoregulaceae archaeon]
MTEMTHVPGRNAGNVILYALSTCVWCEKTKRLLTELGVEFSYLYVDLLEQDELEKILGEIEKFNPKGSFPTLVIDGSRSIVGFREEEIRRAFS